MPIQKIDPDRGAPANLGAEHVAKNGVWHPIGGTRGGQIEGCFEWLKDLGEDEKIFVTIRYTDYEGKEYMTPCIILRDGTLFRTKRIWCELVQAAEPTSTGAT
jgi:hypothetical protein